MRRPPRRWRKDVVILAGGIQGVGVFAANEDERRRHVATCHGWDARENADLIAAAPDLAEALREMLICYDPPCRATVLAHAALDRAEGRAPCP